MHICMYICMYVGMYVCMGKRKQHHMAGHVCGIIVYVHVRVCTCRCVCTCMYAFKEAAQHGTHIRTRTRTHTCIHSRNRVHTPNINLIINHGDGALLHPLSKPASDSLSTDVEFRVTAIPVRALVRAGLNTKRAGLALATGVVPHDRVLEELSSCMRMYTSVSLALGLWGMRMCNCMLPRRFLMESALRGVGLCGALSCTCVCISSVATCALVGFVPKGDVQCLARGPGESTTLTLMRSSSAAVDDT
jgi:hypothetical protein